MFAILLVLDNLMLYLLHVVPTTLLSEADIFNIFSFLFIKKQTNIHFLRLLVK